MCMEPSGGSQSWIDGKLRMKRSKTLISRHARILLGLLLLSAAVAQAQKERRSDFSGLWKQFHTSVVWKDSSLLFSFEEHEKGRILLSTETWSLIENDSALQRSRERPDQGKQVLIFHRQRSRTSS
jgi:hypothetical protein